MLESDVITCKTGTLKFIAFQRKLIDCVRAQILSLVINSDFMIVKEYYSIYIHNTE